MLLILQRDNDNGESTLGTLTADNKTYYTLEDTYRDVKVAGKTRIPAGTYEIKLRNAGGMTKKYAAKFSEHEGMLWLQDVPGFEYIYIHIGNYASDSEGCILVGTGAVKGPRQMITNSTTAYRELYSAILPLLLSNSAVRISIRD